jgi:hypothetical protein
MKLLTIEERNIVLMQEKLKQAQDLLSDVYHFACDEGLEDIESQMSCADSCIIESLDYIRGKNNE